MSPSRGEESQLNKVTSAYREERRAGGGAARAMPSVSPILLALARRRNHLGFLSSLLEVVLRELYPSRIGTSARSVCVRAVHADPGSRVYVQLAVDHQRVSSVSRHRWREGRVVIDLEPVSRGIFYL